MEHNLILTVCNGNIQRSPIASNGRSRGLPAFRLRSPWRRLSDPQPALNLRQMRANIRIVNRGGLLW